MKNNKSHQWLLKNDEKYKTEFESKNKKFFKEYEVFLNELPSYEKIVKLIKKVIKDEKSKR